MTDCLLCRIAAVEPLLELGPQPVSMHFTAVPRAPVPQHDLSLGFCPRCQLVQLLRPFPYTSLVPPFGWITYREPERHLDAVVDRVAALPGIGRDAVVAGVTYKDRTTLDRFARRGFERTWCIDPRTDLGVTDPNANIESVHGLLTPERAAAIVGRRGLADVLIVRHVVEHAEVPWRFLEALGALLRIGGYMVVEVPDCAANLEHQDYTMIWEDHTLYFTAETFARVMPATGCVGLGIEIHPYAFENCLVQIGRKQGPPAMPPAAPDAAPGLRAYVAGFAGWTARYRSALAGHRGGVALYGAGHLTGAFVNFHGLAELVAFVVDDTPEKVGLYLPKSGLPIVSREALDARRVPLCLFGLSPEIEDRVIAHNQPFVREGGRFRSIFAASPRSIRREFDPPTAA